MNIDKILNNLLGLTFFKFCFLKFNKFPIVFKNNSKFCSVKVSGYIKNISAIG